MPEDGSLAPTLLLAMPQLPGHFQTIHLGQHDVKQNHVKGDLLGLLQSCAAVARQTDFELFLAQPLREKLRHLRFVFDDQYVHVESRPRW